MINGKILPNYAHSGEIQEEAQSLKNPIVFMRETTERRIALLARAIIFQDNFIDKIVHRINGILGDEKYYIPMTVLQNPYDDGKVSRKLMKNLP